MKRRLVAAIAIGLMQPVHWAGAEGAPGAGDFTFRRVTVPQPGTERRITVQIAPRANPAVPTPREQPAEPVASPAVAGAVPQLLGSDWFWDAISPRLEDTGPGRLQLALTALNDAPDGEAVVAPRLAALQDIAAAHGIDILRTTVGTRVSPALVLAVIAVESAGASDATSRSGAVGLMQLMPDTAARFGVADSLDPVQNIEGGVAYLDWLLDHFDYDPILAIAAYNSGEGAVRDNLGVPPYPETRDYVPKVLAAWSVARALCLTPPELMTDGCVFNAIGG
jgi:soluble lytic murein transglycosylase-like protein